MTDNETEKEGDWRIIHLFTVQWIHLKKTSFRANRWFRSQDEKIFHDNQKISIRPSCFITFKDLNLTHVKNYFPFRGGVDK